MGFQDFGHLFLEVGWKVTVCLCRLIAVRIRGKLMQTCGVDSGIVTCRHSSANDRTRYTIHPESRKEILKRLLQLNHKMHAEEAKRLPKKKAGKKHPASDEVPQTLL